ncbi:hypothetical protein A0H81_14132 [Grifola frondosa]|uniref:Uncharacterized protein n=1 Tax=Grifola frondosa TaxID=5627 RepID=A0A1C7LMA6_GRIFR|nr:hypothetical protein A0H81_14132 [Grifola frondosa]
MAYVKSILISFDSRRIGVTCTSFLTKTTERLGSGSHSGDDCLRNCRRHISVLNIMRRHVLYWKKVGYLRCAAETNSSDATDYI